MSPRPLQRSVASATPLLPLLALATASLAAQQPVMLDRGLAVRTYASGLVQPTTMAFLGRNDLLVLEKASGRVLRVVDGNVQAQPVLDLPVNSASERGLLGIALDPEFPRDPGVYLFWTESTTAADSTALDQVPLLGNRVDRFAWTGTSLVHQHTLVRLRAYQADANQPLRGNHDGGVIAFGPDHKLYVFMGDNGRRGQMQNLVDGPFGPNIPDDQFGGPEPDDAHLTGVVLRLNRDGSAPADNPFFQVGANRGGEVGANLQKVFSYGHRNSFGMAFDPIAGRLWLQENGDDSFSELNRVEPGMNGGWVQIMGPVDRVAQFREIETSPQFNGLQQVRWPAERIAATPQEALNRLFLLPGARYQDPEFSWKWEVAPGGIGFARGGGLGPQFEGDLFMGGARDLLAGGHLFRLKLTPDRRSIAVHDPRLLDHVADNLAKWDGTESETLLVGRDFGVVTDIENGPDGRLYLVSLSHGAIYELRATPPQLVRGRIQEFPRANAFVLDCTNIPVFSHNLDLRQLRDQPLELRVVDAGTANEPRLEVVAAAPTRELFRMGDLRIDHPDTWEVQAPQGSAVAVWVTATSSTGFLPLGEAGAWLLGDTFAQVGAGLADAQGRLRFSFAVPRDVGPHLVGVSFTAQAAFLTTRLELVLTNADCDQLEGR